jgi:PTH1 family peptidyl-tRNA hydrolase
MKLIVGLGNVGKDYEKTRHNVGFMVLDYLSRDLCMNYCATSKWELESAEATVEGEKVVFMKPQTMMNSSGEPVGKFVEYYKLDPKDVWVVSDDIDLPLGRIRTRDEGSSGGHNGLKSIDQALGTEVYGHIRVGVASAEYSQAGERDAAIFVLDNFAVGERALLEKAVAKTGEIIISALREKQLTSHTETIDLTP